MAFGVSQPTAFLLSKARFQKDFLWEVLLPDIGVSAFGLVGFTLGQLVQEVAFGDYSIDQATTTRFGPYQAHFAGMFKVPRVRMTFLKTMPDAVSAYFKAWKNLIITEDGIYNPKNMYQRTIFIRFSDSTGLTLGQYKFIGAFPITFPHYNLAYSSNTITKVNVEFETDKVEYTTF